MRLSKSGNHGQGKGSDDPFALQQFHVAHVRIGVIIDRSSRFSLPVDVRFAPKAIDVNGRTEEAEASPRVVNQAPKMRARIMRYELSYHEWTAIKPMLPNKGRGVPRVNDRRVLNCIFWVYDWVHRGAICRGLPALAGRWPPSGGGALLLQNEGPGKTGGAPGPSRDRVCRFGGRCIKPFEIFKLPSEQSKKEVAGR
jgi:hypothetical protein